MHYSQCIHNNITLLYIFTCNRENVLCFGWVNAIGVGVWDERMEKSIGYNAIGVGVWDQRMEKSIGYNNTCMM